MAKQDFPALLLPGMHTLTLPGIHALAVAPFPEDARRTGLYNNLLKWTGALTACGLSGTLWLDGSFLTEKPGPSDIDCVLWRPYWLSPTNATPHNEEQVRRLLDRPTAKGLFDLDLYVEVPDQEKLIHRQAYWRGFFGFCHDRATAKGLAEVNI